ncbi:MAG: hypothetical protein Q9227_006862 [Pyrenula ochraceoflavens]
MPPAAATTPWDLTPAIDLLKTLSLSATKEPSWVPILDESTDKAHDKQPSLGNFDKIFDFIEQNKVRRDLNKYHKSSLQQSFENAAPLEGEKVTQDKAVRWRDEDIGTDLEDRREPSPDTIPALREEVAAIRREKRAAKKAKKKAEKEATVAYVNEGKEAVVQLESGPDTITDLESDAESERLRHSPDRKAVIQSILNPTPDPAQGGPSPSVSLSKASAVSILKRDWPVADPFHYKLNQKIAARKFEIESIDGLNSKDRKLALIKNLQNDFPHEQKLLLNPGISDPKFSALNTSSAGVHIFIDISNIMIGFHDCLKLARELPITDRVRRVPMSFHNFSLILERGRPTAKRVLVGSDKYPAIDEAKTLGYETNIMDRVHKSKELTPRQKRFQNGNATSGASSGSETDRRATPAKWVEQGVDELLHMKMLESLVDASKPSTIILATGDAAEAEFSAGFMKMVERALEKGWMVELVSFKLNTSSLYKRRDFRTRWGEMFEWIQLDGYVESLLGFPDSAAVS